MDFDKIVNEFVLDDLLAEELPPIAVQALVDGYDSPALRQLAGADGDDSPYLRTLFSKALEELGIAVPSPLEAAQATARSIAEEVLRGGLTPYEGAWRIWLRVALLFPELDRLRIFAGLASEYEEDEARQQYYARMIVEECERLARG